jgi:hypothetical protein
MSEKGAAHEVPRAAAGRRGLILAAAMMATFMTAVETTIVATAMPTIVADLGDFHLFSEAMASALRSVHVMGALIGLVVLALATRLPRALCPATAVDDGQSAGGSSADVTRK